MAKLTKLTINKVPKASIKELSNLADKDLLNLAKEADSTLLEAKRLKDWIYGAIALKNSNKFNNNNNQALGGNHDQAIYN